MIRPKIYNFCKGSVDTPLTGVDTMLQTQGKIMQNWSISVDTRSSSVDTRDSSQKTQSTSLYRCVDTRSSSVDTRGIPRTPFGPIWDSVSTLDQVVSTLEAFPEHLLGQFGTVCRH
ncbi:hypothetical protein Taro_035451 [Colocasia esculenta]|uniref:Uncharacterized protein n=1 Tax=Colocasia esculenta TaxID=4460 RepID=A0A843VUG2_COLES|nr:hypothetical protein [Colocasia esculenta]